MNESRRNIRPSSLASIDRYSLELELFNNTQLGRWFIAVARGTAPEQHIDDATIALLEGGGFVRKTEFGYRLAVDGRQFARDLGVIPGPSTLETRYSASVADGTVGKGVTEGIDARPINETWAEYKATKSPKLRNLLLEKYLPLVKYQAQQIHSKLPAEVSVADLISAGMFGLIDAVDSYDLQRGVKFETYCAPRVRGAIIDELRSTDWVPRFVRSRAGRVDEASQRLATKLGRPPTDEEIAAELGIGPDEFHRLHRLGASNVYSLDQEGTARGGARNEIDVEALIDRGQITPFSEMQMKDAMALLFKELSREEKRVLVLYYYEDMTLTEIGSVLDLSESRVSQVHSGILNRLKTLLAGKRDELSA